MRMAKRIGVGIVALLLVAVLGVTTKFYALSPRLRPAPDMKAPTSPEAVARGKYLVEHVCGCVVCHSKVHDDLPGEPYFDDQVGAGREFFPMPIGQVRAANITPDPDFGIGRWTDGEVVRAMREGVSRDGRALFKLMPFRTYAQTLSDDDALAVVAYLRTLPAKKHDPGRSEIKFPVSMFSRALPAPLAAPPPPAPPPTDVLARGNWLLQAASCADCHDTMDDKREPLPGMHLAGGAVFPAGPRGRVFAPNITADPQTGIGSWTDDEILEALRHGVSKTKPGRALYSMPWPYFAGMTEDDLKAIVAALRKVPPVVHAVPPAELH